MSAVDTELEAMRAFALHLSVLPESAQLRCIAFFVDHYSRGFAATLYDMAHDAQAQEERLKLDAIAKPSADEAKP